MNFRLIATLFTAWAKMTGDERKYSLSAMQPEPIETNPRNALTRAETVLCDKGFKVSAVVSVRERLGIGLREAKDMVERLHSCPPPQYYCPPLGIYNGNTLPAWIEEAKRVREMRPAHNMYDGMTDEELSA